MGEVGGAVKRIDVPTKFGIAIVAGAFFGGDGVSRKIFLEADDDGPLAALVRLGDQINVTFVVNVRRKRILLAQNLAGFKCGFNRGIKKFFGLSLGEIAGHILLV